MKKNLMILLITFFCVFLLGFAMRFCSNQIMKDIGLWVSFVGSFIIAVISFFICIDAQKQKERLKRGGVEKKDKDRQKNSKDKN